MTKKEKTIVEAVLSFIVSYFLLGMAIESHHWLISITLVEPWDYCNQFFMRIGWLWLCICFLWMFVFPLLTAGMIFKAWCDDE